MKAINCLSKPAIGQQSSRAQNVTAAWAIPVLKRHQSLPVSRPSWLCHHGRVAFPSAGKRPALLPGKSYPNGTAWRRHGFRFWAALCGAGGTGMKLVQSRYAFVPSFFFFFGSGKIRYRVPTRGHTHTQDTWLLMARPSRQDPLNSLQEASWTDTPPEQPYTMAHLGGHS